MSQISSAIAKEVSNNKSILNMLWLNINRRCNLRCYWCYAKMTGYEIRDMSIETVRKHVALAVELGADSVVIIGGEPTLHPQFFEIIRVIKEAGLNPRLVTNGIKFSDKKFLEKTLDAGVIAIVLSFKASNQQMFLADTGVDLFHKQVEAVRNISQSNANYIVSITVCENLMNNFDEMIQAIKDAGAGYILIDTGKPVIVDGKTVVDGMKTPKETAKFIMDVYPKLEKSGLRFVFKLALPFCLFPREFVDKMLENKKVQTGCQLMREGCLMIDSDEKILPCNHLCDLSLGSMGKDFSNAEEYKDFMKRDDVARFYQNMNCCPDKKCVNCSYWTVCGAGCKLYWLHYGAESMLGDFSN